MTSIAAQAAGDSLEGLVSLAVRGDEVAFATIVRRHHVDMVRVAYLVAGDPDIAEDAVAAAWPIVWRRLSSLREPERLRPWLCSVAANEARQLVRRRRQRQLREISFENRPNDGALDPADSVADVDLAAALGKLSPDDRALLALRYVAGLNATELAKATGISASGTRARLGRLITRLRKELGDE